MSLSTSSGRVGRRVRSTFVRNELVSALALAMVIRTSNKPTARTLAIFFIRLSQCRSKKDFPALIGAKEVAGTEILFLQYDAAERNR